jgi:hypothetical protein
MVKRDWTGPVYSLRSPSANERPNKRTKACHIRTLPGRRRGAPPRGRAAAGRRSGEGVDPRARVAGGARRARPPPGRPGRWRRHGRRPGSWRPAGAGRCAVVAAAARTRRRWPQAWRVSAPTEAWPSVMPCSDSEVRSCGSAASTALRTLSCAETNIACAWLSPSDSVTFSGPRPAGLRLSSAVCWPPALMRASCWPRAGPPTCRCRPRARRCAPGARAAASAVPLRRRAA